MSIYSKKNKYDHRLLFLNLLVILTIASLIGDFFLLNDNNKLTFWIGTLIIGFIEASIVYAFLDYFFDYILKTFLISDRYLIILLATNTTF